MSKGVVSALRRRRVLHAWGGSAAGVAALLIDQKLPSESMNLGLASCASLAVGRARPQTSAKQASCVGPAVRRQQESLTPAVADVRIEGRRPGQEPPSPPTCADGGRRQDSGRGDSGRIYELGLLCGSWCGGGLVRRRPGAEAASTEPNFWIIEWSAMDRACTSSPEFLTSDAGGTDEPGPRIPLR